MYAKERLEFTRSGYYPGACTWHCKMMQQTALALVEKDGWQEAPGNFLTLNDEERILCERRGSFGKRLFMLDGAAELNRFLVEHRGKGGVHSHVR